MPVAVKVTLLPLQTFVDEALMLTLGLRLLFTVNVVPEDVAVVALKQPGKVPPAVCSAVTTSPFAGVNV